MEDEARNPYQTPASDVNFAGDKEGITHFRRFSAWAVFGLSLITLGIYALYWLYTRSKIINGFHTRKIADGLILGCVTVFVLSMFTELLVWLYGESELLEVINGLASILYFVLYLVLLFTFRNRLLHLIGSRINPILTFIFSCIYLQYKINVAIDESRRFLLETSS